MLDNFSHYLIIYFIILYTCLIIFYMLKYVAFLLNQWTIKYKRQNEYILLAFFLSDYIYLKKRTLKHVIINSVIVT